MNDYYNDQRRSNGKWVVISLVIMALIIALLVVAVVFEHRGKDELSKEIPEKKEERLLDKKAEKEGNEDAPIEYDGTAPLLGGTLKQIEQNEEAVVAVAENLTPSVVTVVASSSMGQTGQETEISSGSGIVVTDTGYILTNNHVVAEGTSMKVVLYGGDEYKAEIVGTDEASDLAVLKIDAEDLTPAPLADSDQIKTGQMAIAIGSPLGLEYSGTVTVGYVSAASRELTNDSGTIVSMIQTDAAINPGNSGGALANIRGEVIGINTSKYTSIGYDSYGNAISAEGMGYAIPINYAQDIARQLIANGHIPRPWIGVNYYVVSEQDAETYDLPQGLLVRSVVENSPAAKAGLEKQDIITAVNGKSVTGTEEMQAIMGELKVGDQVTLTVYRDKLAKTMDVELTLGDYSEYEKLLEQQQDDLYEKYYEYFYGQKPNQGR